MDDGTLTGCWMMHCVSTWHRYVQADRVEEMDEEKYLHGIEHERGSHIDQCTFLRF
jgi:hypothetical protein